jgi:hypothetical protein
LLLLSGSLHAAEHVQAALARWFIVDISHYTCSHYNWEYRFGSALRHAESYTQVASTGKPCSERAQQTSLNRSPPDTTVDTLQGFDPLSHLRNPYKTCYCATWYARKRTLGPSMEAVAHARHNNEPADQLQPSTTSRDIYLPTVTALLATNWSNPEGKAGLQSRGAMYFGPCARVPDVEVEQ